MNYTYVGTVLVRSDGAVLVQHRDDNDTIPEPNKWGICGGRSEEYDLSDKHAAARELLEETGYKIRPRNLELFATDEFDAGGNHITRKFYWAPYDEKQHINCFEGQEIRFVKPSELTVLDFCEVYHEDYLRKASDLYLRGGIEKK